ncbi:hypothetical protein MM221_11660 [Salipaludibacillus sp. LMS25]|uniref:hypothetical protein n=1 Tax=Salipaludibacillus sp. LMS25 TaxID=2924031 RepID=UPI0020D1D6A5|nr:hypothetical protein [Salipaludibacillus sp. LMS25]UTR13302.1 hypothetical protein MM221_11660 [Salipaludibacillus sp. LMS25]
MLKTTMKILIVLSLILLGNLAITNTNTNAEASSFKHKSGDIMYTKSTQCKGSKATCKGITGHVGIVYGNSVVHIAGKTLNLVRSL